MNSKPNNEEIIKIDFLSSYVKAKKTESATKMQIATLKARVREARAIRYTDMPKNFSSEKNGLETYIINLEEQMEYLAEQMSRTDEILAIIEQAISRVEDEDGRLVLEQFYVYKQKMPAIAEKNFITERTLYRIRKDALQNFQPTDEELRQVEVLLFKNRQKLDRTA